MKVFSELGPVTAPEQGMICQPPWIVSVTLDIWKTAIRRYSILGNPSYRFSLMWAGFAVVYRTRMVSNTTTSRLYSHLDVVTSDIDARLNDRTYRATQDTYSVAESRGDIVAPISSSIL